MANVQSLTRQGPIRFRPTRSAVWRTERRFCCTTPLDVERNYGGRLLGVRNVLTGKRVTECPDCLFSITPGELVATRPQPRPTAYCPRCSAVCWPEQRKAGTGCHWCRCWTCGRFLTREERETASLAGACNDCIGLPAPVQVEAHAAGIGAVTL